MRKFKLVIKPNKSYLVLKAYRHFPKQKIRIKSSSDLKPSLERYADRSKKEIYLTGEGYLSYEEGGRYLFAMDINFSQIIIDLKEGGWSSGPGFNPVYKGNIFTYKSNKLIMTNISSGIEIECLRYTKSDVIKVSIDHILVNGQKISFDDFLPKLIPPLVMTEIKDVNLAISYLEEYEFDPRNLIRMVLKCCLLEDLESIHYLSQN